MLSLVSKRFDDLAGDREILSIPGRLLDNVGELA